jgi:hypothetical protein
MKAMAREDTVMKVHKVALLCVVLSCPSAPCANLPVKVTREGEQIEVVVGGRLFTTYHFDATVAKPYLFPLRSARGTIVTRGFPMVANIPDEDHDEPHQRALYFAHGDINGFDFWGEAAFPNWSRHAVATFGHTVFRKLDDIHDGAEVGTLRAEFDLQTPEGKVIGSETQAYTFRGDESSRMIDCEFAIIADHGPLRIGDSKEGTFAIRVVKALESPPGHMANSNGSADEKTIWGKRADWVDFYGQVEGEEVGIAVFDHPENLRHPGYWHARHYGLLAANPFGLKEFAHDRHQDGSYAIRPGDSLTLRYRVLIHHGDFERAGVAEAYKRYAGGQ